MAEGVRTAWALCHYIHFSFFILGNSIAFRGHCYGVVLMYTVCTIARFWLTLAISGTWFHMPVGLRVRYGLLKEVGFAFDMQLNPYS